MIRLNRFTPRFMSRRIALGFSIAAVLIASGFVISFYSHIQYNRDTERVEQTYQVINALEHVMSLVKDVETGGRGYIITGDSSYLEPYLTAIAVLPAEIEGLHRLVNNNPVQQQRIGTLKQLVASKIDLARLRVQSQSRKQPPNLQARNNTLSGEGKRRMDVLRRHVNVMIATEQALMVMRYRRAERSYRNTLIIILALSLMTFLALAVSYYMLEQELEQRQKTEDQLRAYEARLREQIRLLQTSNEELERFAFVASHDLQEPLRKIQSFATLINERSGNQFEGDSRLFISKITHSAERMSKLIKDLLNFARISNQHEAFKPVRLGQVIQRILDDQELRIKGLNARIDVGELPLIQAVASQMDHLFTNLISNALKFIRPDTQPLVRIRATMIDGTKYADLVAGQRYAEITLEDNGIGFDEKYLDHIFKVFQRLHGKNQFEGTGIGLAICKRVVAYHHGYITAQSQPDQGTTFIIVLPESQSLQAYDEFINNEAYSYSAG